MRDVLSRIGRWRCTDAAERSQAPKPEGSKFFMSESYPPIETIGDFFSRCALPERSEVNSNAYVKEKNHELLRSGAAQHWPLMKKFEGFTELRRSW